MKGRKPKPAALHQAHGTYHATRHRAHADVPVPPGELAEPPAWLTPGQREIWGYAVAHAPQALLRRLDQSVLTVWVIACDLHQRSAALIETEGMTTVTALGVEVISPHVNNLNKQALIMLKAGAEMGFTPSSRTRVNAADTGKAGASRFASLANRRASAETGGGPAH